MSKMSSFLLYIKSKINKIMIALVILITGLFTASCASLDNFVNHDRTVKISETPSEVEQRICGYDLQGEYLKRFQTKDKMGYVHDVTIYDRQYMKIDKVIYAYKFYSLMYYQLSLNILGDVHNFSGTEKIIGINGFATPINNQDSVVSFIFARELFNQKAYKSKYEACQIDGVYFASPQKTDGYIDDFGYWQSYDWWDYFPQVFKTTNRDSKTKLYMSLSMCS